MKNLTLQELYALYGALEYVLSDMADEYKISDVEDYVKVDECTVDELQDKVYEAIVAREHIIAKKALFLIADEIKHGNLDIANGTVTTAIADVISEILRSRKLEKDVFEELEAARSDILG